MYDVIVTFFNYLVYLGFLEPFVYQEATVRQAHSLEPPNKEHAEILKDAISKVDRYDPAVDDKVIQFLPPDWSTEYHYLPRNRTMILNEIEIKRQLPWKRTGMKEKKKLKVTEPPVYWRFWKKTSTETIPSMIASIGDGLNAQVARNYFGQIKWPAMEAAVA